MKKDPGKLIRPGRGMRAGITAAAAALAVGGAVYLYFHNPMKYPLPCMFHFFTGLYCPGCGTGRACYLLLHGHFVQAFTFNPLMVLLLPLIGCYILVRTVDWMWTGENHIDRKISVRFLIWLLAAIFVYGILRNIPVFPFTLLVPGGLEQIL